MSLEDHIEREVQRRLTARLASAGLVQQRMDLEVLFLLPPEFTRAYELMFNTALKEPGMDSSLGGVASGGPGGQVKRVARKSRTSARGKRRIAEGAGAKASSKRYREYWIIRDERALHLKTLIDRRLRRLARDISAELSQGFSDEV